MVQAAQGQEQVQGALTTLSSAQRVCLLLGVLVFITLRALYWQITVEEPFSDMADYLAIAERFRCCLGLEHSSFWQSYLKPALPVVGAVVFSIVGVVDMLAWRVALCGLTLLSLLWLVREVALATRTWWIAIALLFSVAASKSSIFWSYKFATEGLGEALLYLVCAFVLLVSRRPRPSCGLVVGLGVACMFALYNRPNVVLLVPLISVWLLRQGGRAWTAGDSYVTKLSLVAAFCIGMSLVAVPYGLRSYSLYGKFLFSPTQGPYSFLWDFGAVPLTEAEGVTTVRTAQQLQQEAPTLFPNDYEAAVYAKKFVRAWLRDNWDDLYIRLVRNRFFGTIENYGIALSRVSRKTLFSSQLDAVLLDKTPLVFFLGSFGLLLLAIRYGKRLFIIPASALFPWAFGLLFSGDPRLLEPSLPLILFGNVALVGVVVGYLYSLSGRRLAIKSA